MTNRNSSLQLRGGEISIDHDQSKLGSLNENTSAKDTRRRHVYLNKHKSPEMSATAKSYELNFIDIGKPDEAPKLNMELSKDSKESKNSQVVISKTANRSKSFTKVPGEQQRHKIYLPIQNVESKLIQQPSGEVQGDAQAMALSIREEIQHNQKISQELVNLKRVKQKKKIKHSFVQMRVQEDTEPGQTERPTPSLPRMEEITEDHINLQTQPLSRRSVMEEFSSARRNVAKKSP